MRILITGSNGLTGQKIVAQLQKSEYTFLATSRDENRNPNCPDENFKSLDITNPDGIENIVDRFKPQVIINTAAMTNVDACEENRDHCRAINVDGVANLLNCAKLRNIHLIHLSTDFVFDGKNGPYREEDKRNPLSVYARSKYDSENILMDSDYDNWSILRTIIVFGKCENMSRSNIVLWAIDALKNNRELTIVNDQFRAPTWADDLAWACIRVARLNAKGIYHISGPETFSIFELVNRIAKHFGYNQKLIKPIISDTLNQKAKRPPKTGFILDKAKQNLGYSPMKFEECLDQIVR